MAAKREGDREQMKFVVSHCDRLSTKAGDLASMSRKIAS
jgi:hypothetical protein